MLYCRIQVGFLEKAESLTLWTTQHMKSVAINLSESNNIYRSKNDATRLFKRVEDGNMRHSISVYNNSGKHFTFLKGGFRLKANMNPTFTTTTSSCWFLELTKL